jgi:hypothetical protein
MATAVTYNNKRGKAEVLAALDDFRDAVDGDDIVLEVRRIDIEEAPYR